MTKGELIDSVLLAVTSGHLTDESTVMRVDVGAFLEAAIQEFIAISAEQKAYMGMRKARATGINSSNSYSDFMSAREIEITNGYGSLPSFYRLGGKGIESVRTTGGEAVVFVPSPVALNGIRDTMGDSIGAWYEQVNGEDRLYATTNKCKVVVRLAMTLQALEDDDEVPLPPRFAASIIERSVAHFKGQRWNADVIDDDVETITKQQ